MRRTATVLFLLLAVVFPALGQEPASPTRPAASTATPLIPIYVTRWADNRVEYVLRGYGFQVREGLVVTTFDIGVGADDVSTYVATGRAGAYTQTLQFAWDEENGLAVLFVRGLTARPAPFSTRAGLMKGEQVSIWNLTPQGELTYARSSVTEVGPAQLEVSIDDTIPAVGTPVLDSVGDVLGMVKGPGKNLGTVAVVTTSVLDRFFKGETGIHPFGPASRFIRPRGGEDLSSNVDNSPDLAGTPEQNEPPATRLQILNSPRPHYTDAARLNKSQGKVVVKVRFGADGKIARTVILRGLADGLNDEAVVAVYKFRFKPAVSAAGTPVDSSQTVSINFTIR